MTGGKMKKKWHTTFIAEIVFLSLSVLLVVFGFCNLFVAYRTGKSMVSPFLALILLIMGLGRGSSVGVGLIRIKQMHK